MKFAISLAVILVTLQPVWAASESKAQIVELQVTEKGVEPSSADVSPGTRITLKVTRRTNATCATQIKIPAKKLKKDLPLNQTVSIELGSLEKGEIRFACGLDMMSGHILVK